MGAGSPPTHFSNIRARSNPQHLLPSLAQTLEPGYRYHLYVGYDLGDAFYDAEAGHDAVVEALKGTLKGWVKVS